MKGPVIPAWPPEPDNSSGSSQPAPAHVGYAYMRSDGTAYIVWGSAMAGLAAYAYQLLGGRVLGVERFAPVSVLLTVHFLVFIVVLLPIEQLAVRRLTIDSTQIGLPKRAYWLAVMTALSATVLALAGADRFLNGDFRFVAFTLLTIATHFVFVVGRGHLAGRRRFKEYGLASGAASLLRLGAALIVTAIHPSASGFAIALIAGPLVILAWRPFSTPGDPRQREPAVTEEPGLLAGLVLAAAASQALLLAGPVVVGILGGSAAEVSIAFATFTLGRAPLVFGYNLLARVLPPFTRMAVTGERNELLSWARGMALAGVGVSLISALLGWGLGPLAVRVGFGSGFVVGGRTCALIAAGVVLAGAGLFVGQILVAQARARVLALAWLVGLMGAGLSLLLTTGMTPLSRVAASFLVGEAAALAGLVLGAVTPGPETDRGPSAAYALTKRSLDIAASLLLLVILAPVLVLVALAIRVDSPGPIFFRHERVGRGGQTFGMVKLRTMLADADERVFAAHLARLQTARRAGDKTTIRIDGENRVTRVGRLARRWSIDELPNLFNVLRGSMSLVGPRPLVPEEAALIGLDNPRFTVKPGVTGLAQVNGRDSVSLEERTRLDELYVANRSTTGDVAILIQTLGAIRNEDP
ncbi:MAG: sugar transferase [Acidimicrobiia bacterium]